MVRASELARFVRREFCEALKELSRELLGCRFNEALRKAGDLSRHLGVNVVGQPGTFGYILKADMGASYGASHHRLSLA